MTRLGVADVRRGKLLHNSATSEVFAAVTRDGGVNVAVKRTKITSAKDICRFEIELDLLQRCRHPRVVSVVGTMREPPTYAVILPRYQNGALFALLHASRRTFSAAGKAVVIADVAAALAHLHSCGVLHRDVKSDNVLVDADSRAVLTDFNASELESRITSDIVLQARPTGGFFKQFVVGTLPYMAPELLRSVRGAAYTRACDVYSWAILANEVLTQRVPYSDSLTEQVQLHTILEARYNHDSLTAAITSAHLRPETPSSPLPPPLGLLCDLVARGWADDASTRPSAAEANLLLQQVCTSIPEGAPHADAAGETSRASTSSSLSTVPIAAQSAGTPCEAAAAIGGMHDRPAVPGACAGDGGRAAARLAKMLSVSGGTPPRVAAESTAGRRGADRMEDRHVLQASGGVTLAAVFDGHNGDAAASFCAEQLGVELLSAWPAALPLSDAASAALSTSFVALNRRFLAEQPHDVSGCTALAALLVNSTLLVANAGDCQCKLWRGDGVLALSREHIASDGAERARIMQAGGAVSATADGKLRVGGVIQVTRCIGDQPLRKLGLIAEPEMRVVELCAEDKVLLVASDGLWDVMPDDRLLHCLRNTAQSPDLIAKRLIFDAMERGTDDNVSVIVVILRDA